WLKRCAQFWTPNGTRRTSTTPRSSAVRTRGRTSARSSSVRFDGSSARRLRRSSVGPRDRRRSRGLKSSVSGVLSQGVDAAQGGAAVAIVGGTVLGGAGPRDRSGELGRIDHEAVPVVLERLDPFGLSTDRGAR